MLFSYVSSFSKQIQGTCCSKDDDCGGQTLF